MLTGYKKSCEEKTLEKEILEEGKQFPNLDLINRAGENCSLHDLLNSKAERAVAVVIQPGISAPGQWENREKALEEWKSIDGAPGCTGQVLKYIESYEKFKDANTDVIVLVANKSPKQLEMIKDKYQHPFEIYNLTSEALKKLEDHGHSCFEFKGDKYPHRMTAILNPAGMTLKLLDRKEVKAEACANEASETLHTLETMPQRKSKIGTA